jgi:hypothetical protein
MGTYCSTAGALFCLAPLIPDPARWLWPIDDALLYRLMVVTIEPSGEISTTLEDPSVADIL